MSQGTKIDAAFSRLSHDLKNDFIIIRAAAGSIKKNSVASELIEKKVDIINKTLDQAILKLDTTRASIAEFNETNGKIDQP